MLLLSEDTRAKQPSRRTTREPGDLSPGSAVESGSRWLLGREVAAAVATAVVAVGLIVLLSIFQFRGLGETFEGVDDAHRHIRALRRTLILLVDAETGQRGFLLTGRPEFLEPYDSAMQQIDGAMARLRIEMSDTPTDRDELERIEDLVEAKRSIMATSLEAYRRGEPDVAAQIVAGGLGRATMDEFRQVISRKEQEQVGMLGRRSERMEVLRERLMIVLGLGLVLVIVVAAAVVAINRHLSRMVMTLASAQRAFRDSVEGMSDCFFHVDRDWRLTYMNGHAARHFELDADGVVGRVAWEALPSAIGTALERNLREAMQRGVVREVETPSPAQPERLLCIRAYPTPTGLAVFFYDVTEERRLQHQLQHAAKLESIGRLAGGVAHDFNNLLTAILGYVELAEQGLTAHSPSRPHLAGIRHAAERSAALTRQLLTFARKQVTEPRVCNINELVVNSEKLLQRLMNANITIRSICAPNLGMAEVDPDQFEQALINLAINARDAMPEGGKLLIETANATIDEEYAAQHEDVAPGEYVMLAISDTGVGMTEEIRRHIFEPFFTTKRRGDGTGLGLASCYGMVRQARGHISVYSEPNHGSTFRIYLPRVAAVPLPPRRPAAPPVEPDVDSAVVLVVEDEAMVLRLAVRVLESRGYHVLSASTAEEALAIAGEQSGEIDLLITDVILPGMNGSALAQTLAESRPGMRVLFASGYTDNMIQQHGVLGPGVEFLQKPYMPSTLLTRVREVLAPAASAL